MGMYTEFYFRANVKDGEVADWLHSRINFLGTGGLPFDEHPFFDSDRWEQVFWGGGAVYQESRSPIFRRKDQAICQYDNQLVLASSLKNYGSEIESFIDWIAPHLKMPAGDFLGYSLYEDSRPSGMAWGNYRDDGPDQEKPTLYFMPKLPKAAS
jgi:hypothetical protein